jgi:hypothetical protein
MLQKIVPFVVMCVAPLAISAMPAYASVIDWTLQDVVFTDGGAASGTFTTDSTTGDVLSFDITTTSGTVLGGTVYDDTVAQVYDNFWAPDSFDLTDEGAHVYLELAFVDPLTAPETDLLNLASPSYECDNCIPFRIAVSGEAVAAGPTPMPEPTTSSLMFMGLIGLGAARSLTGRERRRCVEEG